MAVRRTPKVFHTSYQPARTVDWRPYFKLWPLLAILFIAAIMYGFFHLPLFNVKTIEIVGAADNGTISSLNNFKGESIFSQSINNEVSHIQQTDLLLASLSCSRGIPNVVRCTATLRKVAVVWQSGNSYYGVDSAGQVFETLPMPPAGSLVIQDKSGKTPTLGQEVITSDLIGIYQNIDNSLKDAGFTVTNLFIQDTLYQVGATVTGNSTLNWAPAKPIMILFDTNSSIDNQVKTAVTVVQTKSSQVTESIDVRVAGYVYLR